jgi:hypothetical protein
MSIDFASKPVWNEDAWTCNVYMPAWRDLMEASAGDRVACTLLTDEREPDDAILATLRRLAEDGTMVREAATAAMRHHYESVRPKYAAFARAHPHFMGDPNVSMPETPDSATFAALHVLQGLFVHPVFKDGLAYVGFSFQARWEPEHGVGVMAHDRRIIEVGGADTAFLTWIAEKDADEGVTP